MAQILGTLEPTEVSRELIPSAVSFVPFLCFFDLRHPLRIFAFSTDWPENMSAQ